MDQIQSFFPAVRIQYTVILFFQDLSYKGLNIFFVFYNQYSEFRHSLRSPFLLEG